MRFWHGLELHGGENLPTQGPALVLLNHASLLDAPALITVDPCPTTVALTKASLLKVPIVGFALRQWGAVPVDREGRDSAGVCALLSVLRANGVVAVAAEGRRSRTGRLAPVNPVLARVAAGVNVPLIPIGIGGSFAALPPGALLPRRRKIVIRVGAPFQLARGTSAEDAARRIRREIGQLLPVSQQPLDEW